MERTDWAALPDAVRRAIVRQTGAVLSAKTAPEGHNSAIALLVEAARGSFFVKGLRSDHPGVVTQCREALINPYVLAVSPRLQWYIAIGGWDLLGFDFISGRQADYASRSPELLKVIDVMCRLGQLTCPGDFVAAAVRGRRLDRRLSQSVLAQRSGISRKWISEFEAGKARAEFGLVIRVLEALGLSFDLSEDPGSAVTMPAAGALSASATVAAGVLGAQLK